MNNPLRVIGGLFLFLLSLSLYHFSLSMSSLVFGPLVVMGALILPLFNLFLSIGSLLYASGVKTKWKNILVVLGFIPFLFTMPLMIQGKVNPLTELAWVTRFTTPPAVHAQGTPRAKQLDPAAWMVTIKGRIAGLLGNKTGKIEAYTKAIAKSPASGAAYSNRSFAYLQAEKWDEALADAQKAIELDPLFSRSYRARGLVKMHIGDVDGGMRDFYKAQRLEPGYQNAKKDLTKAIAEYKKTYNKEPSFDT